MEILEKEIIARIDNVSEKILEHSHPLNEIILETFSIIKKKMNDEIEQKRYEIVIFNGDAFKVAYSSFHSDKEKAIYKARVMKKQLKTFENIIVRDNKDGIDYEV